MDRTTSNYSPEDMTMLGTTFCPGPWDVICARGKDVYEAPGNKRFRALVREHVKTFAAATTKSDKGKVVSLIVNTIRGNSCDGGGFVKEIDGCWYEVGDRNAREKTGQAFRDLLHTKYTSSTKAKARVRKQFKKQYEAMKSVQRPRKTMLFFPIDEELRRFSISRPFESTHHTDLADDLSCRSTSDIWKDLQTQQARPPSPTSCVESRAGGMKDISAEFIAQMDRSEEEGEGDCFSQILADTIQSPEPQPAPVTPPRTTKLYNHGDDAPSAIVTPPYSAHSTVDLDRTAGPAMATQRDGFSTRDLDPLPMESSKWATVELNRASLISRAQLVSFSEAINDLYQSFEDDN